MYRNKSHGFNKQGNNSIVMEFKKSTDLTNIELKQYITSLENEFEAIKAKMKVLCDELKEVETAYNEAQSEIKIRKTIF